jgi:serine/threonine protein kinase
MHEVARGMAYLHSQGVLHGDLKAANVLVDDKFRCAISDFGQSEMKSEAYRISGTAPRTLIFSAFWINQITMSRGNSSLAVSRTHVREELSDDCGRRLGVLYLLRGNSQHGTDALATHGR